MAQLRALLFTLLILMTAALPSAAVDVTLQNDGFLPGGSAAFQGGFVAGEIAASRFSPSGPFPVQVKEVQFLWGGAPGISTITLRIWDDSAGSTGPGTQFYTGDFQVTAADDALQSIDLSSINLFVSGDFRVGIVMPASGLPSVARDNDGINASLNFINASGFGWVQSSLLGVTGDWILRSIVSSTAPTTFTVGGNISGLNGSVVLQNNGGDDLVIHSDGPFVFPTALSDGAPYNVTVVSEPFDQDCVISGASGSISAANVTSVAITCSNVGTSLSELSNDGFSAGQSVAFQAGFVVNEIAAVRLVPSGTSQIEAIRFL
jgi:hypothetical protein